MRGRTYIWLNEPATSVHTVSISSFSVFRAKTLSSVSSSAKKASTPVAVVVMRPGILQGARDGGRMGSDDEKVGGQAQNKIEYLLRSDMERRFPREKESSFFRGVLMDLVLPKFDGRRDYETWSCLETQHEPRRTIHVRSSAWLRPWRRRLKTHLSTTTKSAHLALYGQCPGGTGS